MLLRLDFHLQFPDKLKITIYFYPYIFVDLLHIHKLIKSKDIFFMCPPRLEKSSWEFSNYICDVTGKHK